jgi:hypothetical protein
MVRKKCHHLPCLLPMVRKKYRLLPFLLPMVRKKCHLLPFLLPMVRRKYHPFQFGLSSRNFRPTNRRIALGTGNRLSSAASGKQGVSFSCPRFW